MTFIPKPKLHHPDLQKNKLGFTRRDYEGPVSTLCAAEHDTVFVVEQNRDGQMRSLLINELEIDPRRLAKVVHYDGTPITARFIADAIGDRIDGDKVVPFRKVAS